MYSLQRTRRENIILDPLMDQLRKLANYTEFTLLKYKEGNYKLILYRGYVPQSEALSLNFDSDVVYGYVSFPDGRLFNDDIKIEYKPNSSVIIPILLGEERIAVLWMRHLEPDAYSYATAREIQNFLQREIKIIEAGILYSEEIQHAAEMDSIFEVQKIVASHLDQKTMLDLIAQKARLLTFSQNAYVFLREKKWFVLAAMDQTFSPSIQSGDRLLISSLLASDYETGRITETLNKHFLNKILAALMKNNSNVLFPFTDQDEVKGFLLVTDKNLGHFGNDDKRVMSMLATLTGIYLENTELYKRSNYLAILEERDRLSRELHDDLAQRLAYFQMETDNVDRYLKDGKQEQAESHLTKLELAINDTCMNLREDIFNLREELLPGKNFLGSLEKYLEEYRDHYDLDVQLDNQANVIPELDSNKVAQISRIIQEALVNVRKHAHAKHVVIQLINGKNCFNILICDDGIGFRMKEIEGENHSHFGTTIMRERATSIGGKLSIDTLPEQGTSITIQIPLER